jgi:poly-gamma-glutamate synthesis protein (capsule biosynthesis protein)
LAFFDNSTLHCAKLAKITSFKERTKGANVPDKTVTILAVGDNLLVMKNPDEQFALAAPVLKAADIVVGQLETPCTMRSAVTGAWSGFGPQPGNPRGADPKKLKSLRTAGFNVIHLAGNKIWDAGAPGIEDTVNGLRSLGIAPVGAGMNMDEARTPAVIERKGTKVGFLSYNCVGPKETWANPLKPGCAWLRIVTAYELDHPTPGGNPSVYTFAEPQSLKMMIEDIEKLRVFCDVLVVHFHKGIGMTPALLAMYEQSVSYAAVDAGADLIISEHAHMLRGVELYKGKNIYHGLGHFVPYDPDAKAEERPEWLVKQQQRIFNADFGGNLTGTQLWPKDPLSNLTIIAKVTIANKKITRAGFLPCLINNRAQPEVLKHDERGQNVVDHMISITAIEGLNAKYEWDADEIIITA